MNINSAFCWGVGLVIGMSSVQVRAATTWDMGDNRTQSVSLSKLDLAEVARQEGVGTSADFVLSSIVLSMNSVVYRTIYFKNNSTSPVTPSFKISEASELPQGPDVNPSETYSKTTPPGTIQPGRAYHAPVNINGAGTLKTATLVEDVPRFLGAGTFKTLGAFPVDGWFSSGGAVPQLFSIAFVPGLRLRSKIL